MNTHTHVHAFNLLPGSLTRKPAQQPAPAEEPLPSPAGAGTDLEPLALPPLSGARHLPAPPVPRSIEDMCALRLRQVHHYGHTLAADLAAPLPLLPREAETATRLLAEDCRFQRPGWRHQARRRAIKAAALLCALVDRLDMEESRDPEGE